MKTRCTIRLRTIARHLAACYAGWAFFVPACVCGQGLAPSASPAESVQFHLRYDRVSIDFFETPLAEAIDEIAEQHHLQILFDRASLDTGGVDSRRTVTIEVDDVPLEVALSLILREHELCFSLVDQVVVVLTKEEAEATPMRRVLDIGSFIDRFHADQSATNFMKMIQLAVAPEAWEPNGGLGTMSYVQGQLVICNTYEVIRHVEQLLQDLRKGRSEYSAESLDELGGVIVGGAAVPNECPVASAKER